MKPDCPKCGLPLGDPVYVGAISKEKKLHSFVCENCKWESTWQSGGGRDPYTGREERQVSGWH